MSIYIIEFRKKIKYWNSWHAAVPWAVFSSSYNVPWNSSTYQLCDSWQGLHLTEPVLFVSYCAYVSRMARTFGVCRPASTHYKQTDKQRKYFFEEQTWLHVLLQTGHHSFPFSSCSILCSDNEDRFSAWTGCSIQLHLYFWYKIVFVKKIKKKKSVFVCLCSVKCSTFPLFFPCI